VAKTWYITTPIYYVNGRPHIGHAYTSIVADALARWRRLLGQDAWLLTGTDEHGQKVMEKAHERGMTPIAHADDMVASAWKPSMDKLHVQYDEFMRTTQPRHVACVQAVLQHLFDRGLIYRDTYEGWYSPAAERFWTEKDLVDGKCPDTGQPVFSVQESNWFFKMSLFQEPLLAHIEANPGFIRPENRRNEVLGFLRKPLGDLCISRPKSRMSWGIEIPFDRDYVTYVWFDALLNYLSSTGYLPGSDDEGWRARWPADVQLLGKDILTTHAVYWSSMLLALEVPLPTTLFAHGWWVAADGQKMSKSLGNTIDVDLLVDAYGLDAVRFFLLREIALGADGQFTYDGFLTRINADLANDLGNLAHRGLSMTANWLGGVVPARGAGTGFEGALGALAGEVVARFAAAMDDLAPQAALEALWELVRAGNKYIDDTKPWALNKAGDTERLATVLRTVLEVSHVAASLLWPVMPDKSAELQTKLGSDLDRAARVASGDLPALDALTDGAAVVVGDPLFPRLREQPPAVAAELARIAEAAAALAASAPPPEPKKKKDDKPKKAAPASVDQLITYDDFAKLALRVGRVTAAERHPSADRLLVLQVDIGEAAPRQIVAGIANRFAPDDLVGRNVVVVANLAPAQLRGVASQGMLLAAGGEGVIDLVSVDAPAGEIVR
jgi:methionyl-tRNA synthetase